MPMRSAFNLDSGFNLSGITGLGSNSSKLVVSPTSQELVNMANLPSGLRHSLSQNHVETAAGVSVGNVITGMTGNLALASLQDGHTAVSGNNSPLSDSGISVDNVSVGGGGGNAAMINAAAMAKLRQSKARLSISCPMSMYH